MKDIRVNGKNIRVFVLKETSDRIVYIPLKTLHRVDYDRLLDIESVAAKQSTAMLDLMSTYKLDNGRNALVQYDKIIQVLKKIVTASGIVGERLPKPEEALDQVKIQEAVREASPVAQQVAQPQQLNEAVVQQPKKRGPKPRVKTE
jgi:hypothetical protein